MAISSIHAYYLHLQTAFSFLQRSFPFPRGGTRRHLGRVYKLTIFAMHKELHYVQLPLIYAL